MGIALSRKHHVITVTGLDGAGKSLCVQQLMNSSQSAERVDDGARHLPPHTPIAIPPTLDVNKVELKFRKHAWTLWDLSGRKHMRSMWPVYYNGTNAVIVVVDAWDVNRLELVRSTLEDLDSFLRRKHRHTPIAILLNSRGTNFASTEQEEEAEEEEDITSVTTSGTIGSKISVDDLSNFCHLNKLRQRYPVEVFLVDALHGSGVYAAIEWINFQLG
eukprot:gb/GECG01004751.1/.p1 GENE.gb/GECG01004751.1/~~gb/GECG01004751.1/.p1  ORF type:complete len:217 (+),score=29.03 gb/GECG01004751.1/:1-651(+)